MASSYATLVSLFFMALSKLFAYTESCNSFGITPGTLILQENGPWLIAALVQSPSEASCTPGQPASYVIERPSRKRGGKQYNIDCFILRTMNSWREELQALGHLIFQVM